MNYWVGVACEDHVKAAVAGGFVQLGHGKMAPVLRLHPGDLIAFYSPRAQIKSGLIVRKFTAIGRVARREPYLYAQSATFEPMRRDVKWFTADAAAVEPLLGNLSFISSQKNWGLAFRRGLINVTEQDMRVIAGAMKALAASSF